MEAIHVAVGGVERMHAGEGVHDELNGIAISCFEQALADVGIERGSDLGSALHDYFAWATTTTMSRHPDSPDDVPPGLAIPRWSWDGLQPVS